MARQMVTRFGMSTLGSMSMEGQPTEVFLGRDLGNRSEQSEDSAAKVDRQVRSIVQGCYQMALKIMLDNREAIDRIVDILIDKETLSGEDFRQIVAEYTVVPEKERYVPQM